MSDTFVSRSRDRGVSHFVLFIQGANCLICAEPSNDGISMLPEERRCLPKRRRIGTNTSSGTVISTRSNQFHASGEKNVAAKATKLSAISQHTGSEEAVSSDSDVRANTTISSNTSDHSKLDQHCEVHVEAAPSSAVQNRRKLEAAFAEQMLSY